MARSTAARFEARFKQLCCLGLGGEAVMPALFNELRAIVPSVSSTFFFADANGALANIYEDSPETPTMVRVYMEEFHGRRERLPAGFDFAESMRQQSGVLDCQSALGIEMKTFRGSELYNVFYRRHGWDSFLRLIVRDRGRGLGRLTLHRAVGERPFSPEDKRRVAALQPFFAHALSAVSEREPLLVESGTSGLIIADPTGKPAYASKEGQRLLFLATHPRIASDIAFSRLSALPAPLAALCRNLSGIFSDDPHASAPTYRCRNVWGGFRFRAQRLNGEDPASGLIGITVDHEEPLPLKLMRRVEHLPLSYRQAQVCLLMANGASNGTIAEQLGISKHTAIAHGRWIYNKLDVHNRAELVSKLLTG